MAHTVQLCYLMSYTAHFFALIPPRKVQYCGFNVSFHISYCGVELLFSVHVHNHMITISLFIKKKSLMHGISAMLFVSIFVHKTTILKMLLFEKDTMYCKKEVIVQVNSILWLTL